MGKIIAVEGELRQGVASFNKVINIQNECINGDDSDIVVDLSKAKFINPAFLSIFGSLLEIKTIKSKRIVIRINDNNKNNIKSLKDSGIWDYYKQSKTSKKQAFRFRILKDERQKNRYSDELVGCLPVECDGNVREFLTSAIIEVVNNAFEHGKSQNGIYSLGDFDAGKKHFVFSIYDDGVGIPYNVKKHLKCDISDCDALEWALTDTYSTRDDKDNPGGSGLSFLEKFANCNGGNIYIVSGNAFCSIRNNKRKFAKLNNKIVGTLFVMNITADNDHKYVMRGR